MVKNPSRPKTKLDDRTPLVTVGARVEQTLEFPTSKNLLCLKKYIHKRQAVPSARLTLFRAWLRERTSARCFLRKKTDHRLDNQSIHTLKIGTRYTAAVVGPIKPGAAKTQLTSTSPAHRRLVPLPRTQAKKTKCT